MNILEELKRRHVYRVAVAYVIVGWILIQVVTQVFPVFAFPNWVEQLVVILVLIGFPIALLLAWAFDVTPAGVIRTDGGREADAQAVPARRSRRGGLAVGLVGVLVAVIAGAAWWQFERGRAVVAPNAAAVSAQRPAVSPVAAVSTGALASEPRAVTASTVAAQPIPAKSVAVLPFESLSADKNNAYFADGMQDLILTKLADIGDLKVIARTSTMQYGSHPQNLTLVGQQLGVATNLEGSVQKPGNQVLINVQLIDVKTDSHIWAESYTRTLDNIFGVEGEVAAKVAEALNAKLTASETAAIAKVPTTNAEAYTLYLKGQYEFGQYFRGDGDPERLRRAEQYWKDAVAHDPRFALAYAALSQVDGVMVANAIEDSPTIRHDMVDNAHKALALQPELGAAHFALGFALYFSRPSQGDAAIRELQTAARLMPNGSGAHNVLAEIYAQRGHWTAASAEIEQALRLDPQNGFNYEWSANIDLALRRYGRGQQMLARCLAVDPTDVSCRDQLADVFLLSGDPAAARAQLMQLPEGTPDKYLDLTVAWLWSRNPAQAVQAAQRIPEPKRYRDAGTRGLMIGRAELAAGDNTRAHAALDLARTTAQAALAAHPDESHLYNRLARIEMWSEDRDAALRAADKAIDVATGMQSPRRMVAYASTATKAEVLAHFGDAAGATAIVGKLFETPGTGRAISPAGLKLDPVWDPIRHDPAFQTLLKKYGKSEPVPSASAGSASTP